MKKIIFLFILCTGLFFSISGIAQPPPPPTNPSASENKPVGAPAGAPVGNGTLLLISLAGLYAARKVYTSRKEATN